MRLIGDIFYFFTPYTDARERAVGRFFKGLTERSRQSATRIRLGDLLQRDIAAINLWTEYRYKGYTYLHKARRKELYANLQLITDDFDRFYATHAQPPEATILRIHRLVPGATVDTGKITLLQALMDYFSPVRDRYEYRKSSSFGRLLRDPSHEKLVGDCNQIVTLYLYLYSRYYDVHDIQIRTLPEHVALHYGGIDIETTTGTFADYSGKTDTMLLPIESIVSINLMDTTDSYLSTHEVSAEDVLQAARFAFILSHNRDIVARNLEAAYSRLVDTLMKRHNYKKALEFAEASQNITLLSIVGHNGAAYEMAHHNYAAARHFARHALDREALTRSCWQAEGAQHYRAHRYHDALKAFKHTGDLEFIRQCYAALFFEEQEKLGSELTIAAIRKQSGVIKRMRGYAKKSENKKLITYTNNLHKYL
jgi:hypothetical protein